MNIVVPIGEWTYVNAVILIQWYNIYISPRNKMIWYIRYKEWYGEGHQRHLWSVFKFLYNLYKRNRFIFFGWFFNLCMNIWKSLKHKTKFKGKLFWHLTFDTWHLTFWTYLDIFIFQKYFDMICKIMELLEFSDQELTVSFGSFVINHQLLVNKMIIVHHLCNFGYLSTFFC